MTSRNCSKDYRPGWKLFSFTLKRQTGITLLVTAFLFLICPGMIFQAATQQKEYGHVYDLCYELPIWGMVIFFASLILGVILLCYNHNHLFSRKAADLYYALPIRRDSFLLIRFGASIVGAVFAMTVSFTGLTFLGLLNYVDSVALSQMLNLYVLVLLLLLLCMSTVLIFIVNSGGIFHFLFSTAVVCAGIPALCLIGYYWFQDTAYGVVGGMQWLEYVSPFGYAVIQFAKLENMYQSGEVILETSTLLISIGGSLMFTAISVLMNHSRKAEKSGSSFAYAAMPVLITVLASAVGGYLVGIIFDGYTGADSSSFWLYFTIGALLVSIAAGAIISKSFRKIWRWLICAGVSAGIMLSLFLVTTYLGKLNFNYVPPVARISSIQLEGDAYSPTVTLHSDFELVTELHEHILDRTQNGYGEYAYSDLLSGDFDITYVLDNGETVSRTYWLSDRESYELLLKIVQTDDYTNAWADDLDMLDCDGIQMEYYSESGAREDVTLLTQEEATQLLNVYAKELQNASNSDLWQESTYYITVTLYGNNRLALFIPQSFTQTVRLVQELLD